MTGKQTAALTALLSGKTKGEAAKLAGVSSSTLRRWLTDDTAFKAAYRRGLDGLLQDASAKARAAMGEAVDTLKEIMLDTDEQATPRISAADKVLGHGLKLIEAADILARLQEIEDQIGGDET